MFFIEASKVKSLCIMGASRLNKTIINNQEVVRHNDCLVQLNSFLFRKIKKYILLDSQGNTWIFYHKMSHQNKQVGSKIDS